MVDEDVDDAFAELTGVDLGRTRENEAPEPVQCKVCHYVNPPGARFCGRCGRGITEEARNSRQGILAKLQAIAAEDPVLALEVYGARRI